MYMQIKKIVLWPRKAGLPPRFVPFQLGALNVITGLSKTGKSAVIPIIDYCLAADKCSIPVHTIRDACSWFGVVFDTLQGELLLARREPGTQKATGDMYVAQGRSVAIPRSLDAPNSNASAVKLLLNELAGLTQLNFDPEETGLSFRERPSFRDMTAFVFQPQNIVANPNVLFYKADTAEHREKLRVIFPYVLGAVTAEVLALRHEHQRLTLQLRRKEREFNALQDVSVRWISDIKSWVSRARELGLLLVPLQDDASVADLVDALRSAAAPVGGPTGRDPDVRSSAVTAAANELILLQQEEGEVSTELSRLKHRFAEMNRFREAATDYRGSLVVRRDRLQIADWVGRLFDEKHECPLCGTVDASVADQVASLRSALHHIEAQAISFAQIPAAFDREYQRVEAEIDLSAERLNAVRTRRRVLQGASEEVRTRQYELAESIRFAGALSEALLRYDELTTDGDLAAEVKALKERLLAIDTQLRAAGVLAAERRARQRFTNFVGRILPRLDAERPNDPVELLTNELTIQVTGTQRDDYLWEIGSGANWLSYHIATSIALHELFRGLPRNHVPTFAVYDQPSQVYFPSRSRTRASDADDVEKIRVSDEDIVSARKVFDVLAAAARESNGEWQAIVLDHADSDVWGGIDGLNVAADWHNGEKLIPKEWLDV